MGVSMSNDVCGYVHPSPSPDAWTAVDDYILESELGIFKITSAELFNYPPDFLPSKGTFVFLIGDRPGYPNATYLTDYDEYDPLTSDIGFPSKSQDRVAILLEAITEIASICKAEKIVFSISDSSQIEAVRRINMSDLYEVVLSDFEKHQAPPDTLYEVFCGDVCSDVVKR
ncbi:hypothetical protein SAMN04490179_4443 [Pseudomonas antarctica]|uniref:Uncharacterized protein n=2 Tax=Pseudomonas antarctica TaxID=219572 RepID=A0A1H0BRP7_9PSED|nr:hypothetical protein PSAN_47830 [Pseudomonas antarctica]SDN48319.1 hypothetical protein SAMN04490179_4443 [Pseudomonas antarctica]